MESKLSVVEGVTVDESQDGRSVAALGRLVRAVRDLASARDLADVVEVVRHAARELVNADGATFVLRDHGQCFYVDEDAIEPLWRGQRFPLEACVSGYAMVERTQVTIPDIYLDDRVPHEAYRPTFVRSMTMTPVRADEPIAAIGTYWATPHDATAAELELLQTLADSAAVALESARVLRNLEELVAVRTAELTEANRDLEAFAHTAAHDLRTPLTSISLLTELIHTTEAERLSEAGLQDLESIQRQALRLDGVITGILGYSRAAMADLDIGPVDFNELVADVTADLRGLIEQRAATVSADALPTGTGGRVLLERVLQNLVSNAVQYGDPAAPQVHITGRATEGHVEIGVSDNGSGVSAQDQERIFEMFARGSAGTGKPGTGVGLAFARRIAVRHAGTLVVDEGPLGGARFTLRLPCA